MSMSGKAIMEEIYQNRRKAIIIREAIEIMVKETGAEWFTVEEIEKRVGYPCAGSILDRFGSYCSYDSGSDMFITVSFDKHDKESKYDWQECISVRYWGLSKKFWETQHEWRERWQEWMRWQTDWKYRFWYAESSVLSNNYAWMYDLNPEGTEEIA